MLIRIMHHPLDEIERGHWLVNNKRRIPYKSLSGAAIISSPRNKTPPIIEGAANLMVIQGVRMGVFMTFPN